MLSLAPPAGGGKKTTTPLLVQVLYISLRFAGLECAGMRLNVWKVRQSKEVPAGAAFEVG